MGVIDPAGFDTNMRKNSFEQLIYNVVNEQMAYHYNQCVFVDEIVLLFNIFKFTISSSSLKHFITSFNRKTVLKKELKLISSISETIGTRSTQCWPNRTVYSLL